MPHNAVRGSTLVLNILAVCLTASAQDIFTIPPGQPDRNALGGTEVRILCNYSESLAAPPAFGDLQPASVEAQRTINTMLKKIGVKKAIPAYVGPVPNAAAAMVSGQGVIIYNTQFMQSLSQKTNNHWAVISVLAHELGHHINLDTAGKGGSTPPGELRADFFSGWIMRRLGARLHDAVVAMQTEGSPVDTPTHPAKDKRIREITNGFNDNDDKHPTDPTGPDIPDESGPSTRRKPQPQGDPDTQEPPPESQEPDGTGNGNGTGTEAPSPIPSEPFPMPDDRMPFPRGNPFPLPDGRMPFPRGNPFPLPDGRMPFPRGNPFPLPDGRMPFPRGNPFPLPEGRMPFPRGNPFPMPEGRMPFPQGSPFPIPRGPMRDPFVRRSPMPGMPMPAPRRGPFIPQVNPFFSNS